MATAPSSLGTQLREELSCSICLELFTRPKVLPCQHTFCQDCIQDVAVREETFQCPNCRQQVEVPPQGVEGFPDNHLVTSLCDRLQNQATLSEETREQPQPENKCNFHRSEELKLYCKQCQVSLCVDCVGESHEGHPTMSLKKATQERRDFIAEGRNILDTKYFSFLRGLREEEKNLDGQKQETDSKIEEAYRQACDQIHQKLTEEKDRLLSAVETSHMQNKVAIQNYRDDILADVEELSSVCDAAEQAMVRQGESLGVETNLAEVVQRFGEQTVPYLGQCQPAVFQPIVTKELLGRVKVPSATGKQKPPDTYVPILTFGQSGTGSGKLSKPFAAAVSNEGEIFVANDAWDDYIQVFTLQGDYVCQLQTVLSKQIGSRKPDTMRPLAVAMNKEGNLLVVGMSDDAKVVVYTKQGFLVDSPGGFWLKYPGWRGVAVDSKKGHILISQTTGNDQQNNHGEVQVYTIYGAHVKTVGRLQGMKDPHYITVDGEGNILVSDRHNHCVYVYNGDGQFLFKFGGKGSGEGQLNIPCGICTDRAGNIIVADSVNKRVEMFDKTGRFLKHISTDMEQPRGVAMAPQGQLVVTDSHCNTITVFGTK